MNSIKATWTNGKIVPTEPVDWPDGSPLLVECLPLEYKIGLTEAEWRDDPKTIAAWIEAVENMEPLVWAEGEREDIERYHQQSREFNREAVRRKMDAMGNGDAP